MPPVTASHTMRMFGSAVAIIVPSGDHATDVGFVEWACAAKRTWPDRSHTRRKRSADTVATCCPLGLNATSVTMSVADVLVSASLPAGTVVVPPVSLSVSSRSTYVSFDWRRYAENPKYQRFASRVAYRSVRS